MDEPDDPMVPRLPPPPSLPPSLPATPSAPAAPSASEEESDVGSALLPADRLATRHVPTTRATHLELGLPTTPVAPAAPTEPDATSGATTGFVRPDLVPMGDATAAVLVGRVLFAVAALLIGIAARRSAGTGGGAFWPVVWSTAVFTAVGGAGLIFWSAQLADNARRLRCRSATPRTISASWLAVVVWVALSCLTYLRIEVDGDLDPLPGVAAVGWAIVVAIAYGQLQGVFRGLSRTPPVVWIAAFPIDVVAFGLVWWRLTSWPSPIGGDADEVRMTSNVAFGAAAALTVNVFVFARLAQRGSDSVYERLGRLEARRRGDDGPTPEWFHAGLAAGPPNAASNSSQVMRRPLIRTRAFTAVVAALHVVWGVGLVVFGVLLAKLAFDYADLPVFFGDDLALADADADRVVLVGTIVGVAYVAAIVAHGVWAVLTAINARRITVHSPNPGTFAIAFTATPLLLGAGLVIGGRLGYWLVVAGLTVAFFALVLVNQMLMTLAARLGGDLSGFSRWTLCLVLAYLAGVALNLLFARSTAQLGFYATLSFLQGVLIVVGGVIGFRAMRVLEQTLSDHRQAPRSDRS